MANKNLEIKTHPGFSAGISRRVTCRVPAAILFYDRQRRVGLKRLPLGSPFVLPRVGELVRLPIANDVATEYCVVDIRYLYRESDEEQPSIECGGRAKRRTGADDAEESGMKLECVRIELDPLL